MDALIIKGPAKLAGVVEISGSKNTALPLLFTSLLFDSPVRFENVPRLWDIETTLSLLDSMGTESQWNKDEGTVTIYPKVRRAVAPYEWVKKMRAGILALGPLIAKTGEARVSLPGGCAIGARPVNFHLDALRKMGASIEVSAGYINARVPTRLRGAHIEFPQVTVTGTENLLIVAATIDETTVLENCALEPEVVALGEALIAMGAKISGLGRSRIEIRGGKLSPPATPIRIPPDRIEAGTLLAAAVVTRSELSMVGCEASAMGSVLEAFRTIGARFEVSALGNRIDVFPCDRYSAIRLDTQPYPGFPTDMQAQMMVAMCRAEGKSSIRETIFENRFMHVAELQRMGAKVSVRNTLAVIDGPCELQGAPIMATDLRASASLVLAALCAEGETKISRIYHLDRGYQRLDEKLKFLGADISRISE